MGLVSLVVGKSGCLLQIPDVEGWGCETQQDCLDPLVCENRVCSRPCFSGKDCKEGRTCSNGYCRTNPNPDGGNPDLQCIPRAGGEICNGLDDNCDQQIDENGVCEKEGKVCEPGSQGTLACTGGLVCTSLSLYPDRPRVCLRPCDENNPSSCPAQFQCLRAGVGNQAVCMQVNCEQDNQCVYKEDQHIRYGCVRVGGSNRLCLPSFTKKGANTVGQRCAPWEDIWCDALSSCVRRSNQSDGVCSVRCSTQADCPKDLSQATCQTIENNIKICWRSCNSPTDCGQDQQCSVNKLCEALK